MRNFISPFLSSIRIYKSIFHFSISKHVNTRRRWKNFLSINWPFKGSHSFALQLIKRPFKPYLRPWLSAENKVDILISHYTLLARHFPNFPPISDGMNVQLASLRGKSGSLNTLILGRETTKEGELYVSFINESGERLATLRIVFEESNKNDRPICWIGGLQGAKPPVGRESIVAATRDLYGLRPKHAVLVAACALCEQLDIALIIAPMRSNHISQRGWRRWSIKRKITADYDKFWNDFTALRRPDGDFLIELPLSCRLSEDVKSKKRREWIRRHELLDFLYAETITVLAKLASPNVSLVFGCLITAPENV